MINPFKVFEEVIIKPIVEWGEERIENLRKFTARNIIVVNGYSECIAVMVVPGRNSRFLNGLQSIASPSSMAKSIGPWMEELKKVQNLDDISNKLIEIDPQNRAKIDSFWNIMCGAGIVIERNKEEIINEKALLSRLNYFKFENQLALAGGNSFDILIMSKNGKSIFFNSPVSLAGDVVWVVNSYGVYKKKETNNKKPWSFRGASGRANAAI